MSLAGGELGHGLGEGHGAAIPVGDNCKGGSSTVSVGNKERSRYGVEVGVAVVKGNIVSSNTTWREMRTRREVRSKHGGDPHCGDPGSTRGRHRESTKKPTCGERWLWC